MANPWSPMYWGDLLKKTSQLTCQQFGVYMRLLGYYYTNDEAPPANADALHRICIAIAKAEQEDVQVIIRKFFQEQEGHYHNKRADEELSKSRDISSKRAEAARASHANRVQKPSKKPANGHANRVQLHTQPQPHIQPQSQSEPEVIDLKGGSSSTPVPHLPSPSNDNQSAPPDDGLPIHAVAAGMIENLQIPKTQQLLDVVAQAIDIVAAQEKCTRIKAAEFLHHAATLAMNANVRVNRFWFEDQKYGDFLGTPKRDRKPCAKHPQSGLTQWGTCWDCYVESSGSEVG